MCGLEKKINLIDLFAGAGGLSDGFVQTGRFKVVGAVENNRDAVKTYTHNHTGNQDVIIRAPDCNTSDITQIDFKKILNEENINGNETVVIGGPPCQGFSNANRQKNYLISGNNQLVKEYVRAIEEIKPMAFLMENVQAMKSARHKFFVTKDSARGIYRYSSESHLLEITKQTKNKPFWIEEEMVLIRTENTQLKPLIELLLEQEEHTVILTKQSDLSRIRSIIRNLRRKDTYNANNQKEKREIQEIIDNLKSYMSFNLNIISDLEDVILSAINTLKSFLLEKNQDNDASLQLLLPFIEINQLLRYLNELVDEHILCIGNAKILPDFTVELIVTVQVKSYSIVKYLEVMFESLGYATDFDVMVASDFGVPQKRSRFMILGVKQEVVKNRPVRLPSSIKSKHLPFTVFDAIGDLEEIKPTTEVSDFELNYIPHRLKQKPRMLSYFRRDIPEPILYNHVNTASRSLSVERFQKLRDNDGKNFHSLPIELKDNTYTDGARTQNTVYLRLNYNELSPTVLNVRKSMWQHPKNAVALSIREAARLQSFKDDYIFKGTKDQQYQQIGNAVPPLLARAVAERILHIIGENPKNLLTKELEL